MSNNKELYVALLEAQRKIKALKKDEVNPHFRSGYVSLNSLRETIMPILQEQGLILLQPTSILENGSLVVNTIIIHAESGQSISSVTPVISKDPNDAQKVGSGISYARRYAIQSLLFLSAEDDDGNEASNQEVNRGGSTRRSFLANNDNRKFKQTEDL